MIVRAKVSFLEIEQKPNDPFSLLSNLVIWGYKISKCIGRGLFTNTDIIGAYLQIFETIGGNIQKKLYIYREMLL